MDTELEKMIKEDIDYALEQTKNNQNIEIYSELYSMLMGKYSSLPNFPKVEDNSLWLKTYPDTYKENVNKIIGFLKMYSIQNKGIKKTPQNDNKSFSKIFIVHGHNSALKESVARVVGNQGITPIILSEQANTGNTIIEKLEKYTDVGAAICLFSNDDVGKEKSESELKPRARQNVVFETGFFMGYLGREHIIILSDSENELPGDLSGMVYTNTQDWKVDLCKDLKTMGFDIDFNKLF